MTTITIRILGDLDERLNQLSRETGILKSSLILYALNERLRDDSYSDGSIFTTDSSKWVRMTLRLPQPLKARAEQMAQANGTSVNMLINHCVYLQNMLFWSAYKPLPIEQEE